MTTILNGVLYQASPQSKSSWVVKNPRGDIIGFADSREQAAKLKDKWNNLYQETAYYFEPWKDKE